MNNSTDPMDDVETTLDPPGSIAVVGAGAIGIEAALYGRFLGYDVTLIEAVEIGHSMVDQPQKPLPMLPGRCLSPLAISALRAQKRDMTHSVLPTTCGQWIHDALVPLTQTDLLRGRLRIPMRVTEIRQIEVQADQEGEDTSDIPSDFRLTLVGDDQEPDVIDVEAVILAVGVSCDIQLGFDLGAPYFFRVAATSTGDLEQDLLHGLREIVAIFAALSGRADLDLYRPRRV